MHPLTGKEKDQIPTRRIEDVKGRNDHYITKHLNFGNWVKSAKQLSLTFALTMLHIQS